MLHALTSVLQGRITSQADEETKVREFRRLAAAQRRPFPLIAGGRFAHPILPRGLMLAIWSLSVTDDLLHLRQSCRRSQHGHNGSRFSRRSATGPGLQAVELGFQNPT